MPLVPLTYGNPRIDIVVQDVVHRRHCGGDLYWSVERHWVDEAYQTPSLAKITPWWS